MKNLLSILLILCMIFPFFGTFSVLQIEKSRIKSQVKSRMIEGMGNDVLVMLSFSQKEAQDLLKWEHSREFEYCGQMYDVFEVNSKGDSLHYLCWLDSYETEINIQLSKLVNDELNQSPQQKENLKRLQQFQLSLFFNQLKNNDNLLLKDLRVFPSECQNNYSSVLFTPPDPPPKIG